MNQVDILLPDPEPTGGEKMRTWIRNSYAEKHTHIQLIVSSSSPSTTSLQLRECGSPSDVATLIISSASPVNLRDKLTGDEEVASCEASLLLPNSVSEWKKRVVARHLKRKTHEERGKECKKRKERWCQVEEEAKGLDLERNENNTHLSVVSYFFLILSFLHLFSLSRPSIRILLFHTITREK